MNSPLSLQIDGTGMALPASIVTSEALDLRHGRPAGWFEAHSGVRQRHVCIAESQEELAVAAVRQAIDNAGLATDDIDLIISCAAVARQPIPSMAPLIALELGLAGGRVAAFDINATCLGFVAALDLVAAQLATGRINRAVIVAAEIASRALPWVDDPVTAGLFGDGAAAVVVSRGADGATGRLLAARFETWPEGHDLCQIESGGTRHDFHREPERFAAGSLFQMDGRGLFQLSAREFPGFVTRLLAAAGWDIDAVDLVVPHQASPLALQHLVKRCGFAADRVIDIVATHGNQVSASIPTALHLARASGRVTPGTRLLILGTSAGVSFGGLALEI